MAQSITFPNLPQRPAYCSSSDVLSLIGNTAPILSNTVPASSITNAIDSAMDRIDAETRTFFSPRRIIDRLDGNGKSRIKLPHQNVIAVNYVKIFFSYPLATSRTAYDWDFQWDGTERKSGTLAFPTYAFGPSMLPFAYLFFRASRNVTVDAWYGPTRFASAEILTSTDQQTFKFAHDTVVKQAVNATYPGTGTSPDFYPVIYKNGVEVVNTTYELVPAGSQGNTTDVWQITADNVAYAVNTGANGYTGITFNSPVSAGDVITADYVYWYVPDDVREATAKLAACTLLSSFGTAVLSEQQFQGASEIQIDGARLQYQGGPFGATIKLWQDDVSAVISRHKVPAMAFGFGNPSNWGL